VAPQVQLSRFNYLGFENLKRMVGMVDVIPASVADAKRILVTVCFPCVDGKMARSPHHRSTTTSTKCELVHTDVHGPLTESLGGSVYFMKLMEDSTGFITATPIKTKGMVPDVLKARITQLEALTGLKVKRVCREGAKEYVSHDLKAWYDNKGITSKKTALYSSQQNGKAERANRYIMERVRVALLDAGAGEELWTEALSSVIHVRNPSFKAGQDVTPLEALTGRRPDVKGFCVWGIRAWAFKPKQQQRKLESRTDVGRFVGYTVGGKAYRILEDDSNKIFERRDVLMEVIPSKTMNKTSVSDSSASPRLTAWTDGDKDDGAMNMLDAEVPSGDAYAPQQSSESDGAPDKEAVHDAEDGDDDEDNEDVAPQKGHQVLSDCTTVSDDDGAQEPRRSKRKPAPKVTWWESISKAYVTAGPFGDAKSAWALRKPPTNAKEARARSDWLLLKAAEKEEYLPQKKLGTWSKTKNNNKRKAVKTRYVYDIKRDSEGNETRCKARLVAQGCNQIPGRDFDETWAPVPSSATTRAFFAVAAAKDWKVHHVNVKTAFLNAKMDKEMYIILPDGTEPRMAHDVFRLNLALYGTKQAESLWGIKLDKELKAKGAVRSKVDPCLYTWSHPSTWPPRWRPRRPFGSASFYRRLASTAVPFP